MSNHRVLIVGYGKMGKIHGKHLDELGVENYWCDPPLCRIMNMVPFGIADDIASRPPTHVIISTPTETHRDVYELVASMFNGPILIEKPVVTKREHLYVLEDSRVFAGMSERFNPVTKVLHRVCSATPCKGQFLREVGTGRLDDIAIHDIDMAVHLGMCNQDSKVVVHPREHTKGFSASTTQPPWPGPFTQFTWGPGAESGGKAHVRVSHMFGVIPMAKCDMIEQSINKVHLEHQFPIQNELEAFLRGDAIDARLSHRLLVDMLEMVH